MNIFFSILQADAPLDAFLGYVNVFFSIYVKTSFLPKNIFWPLEGVRYYFAIPLERVLVPSPKIAMNLPRTYEN